jgi:hypothetical protein
MAGRTRRASNVAWSNTVPTDEGNAGCSEEQDQQNNSAWKSKGAVDGSIVQKVYHGDESQRRGSAGDNVLISHRARRRSSPAQASFLRRSTAASSAWVSFSAPPDKDARRAEAISCGTLPGRACARARQSEPAPGGVPRRGVKPHDRCKAGQGRVCPDGPEIRKYWSTAWLEIQSAGVVSFLCQ